MKKFLLAILTITALTTISAQAQVPPPTLNVYLEKWTRTHKPVNEICLDATCGSSNSIAPNKKTIHSLYSKLSDGPEVEGTGFVIDKKRITLNVSAPAYHSTSTIVERFLQFPTSHAGTVTITSSIDNGDSFQVNGYVIDGLDLGETYSRGTLSRNVYYDNGHAYNAMELTDTSKTVLVAQGGTGSYEFTYLVPVKVREHIMDQYGALLAVSPPVPCGEVTFPGTDGIVALTGDYTGYCGLRVKVVGGLGFQKFDITPACNRAFYIYDFLNPILVNVRPYHPGDN